MTESITESKSAICRYLRIRKLIPQCDIKPHHSAAWNSHLQSVWPARARPVQLASPQQRLKAGETYRIVETVSPASSAPTLDKRDRQGGRVQSLSRAIAILRIVADTRGGIALNAVARAARLAPSTAHRLLTTLKHERLVQDDGHGLWLVGPDAFAIGSAFLRERNILDFARPVMQRLMRETGETVNLAVEVEGEALYLTQVECEQIMRAFSKPGTRVPMHSSAVGKALLAELPASRVAVIVQRHGLPRITDRTITHLSELDADLEAVRQRGYAIDDAEHAVGLRCIAAAIRSGEGLPVAALSVSAPAARVPDQRIPELGAMVRRAADEIAAASGRQT